jgi:hypothetical protein
MELEFRAHKMVVVGENERNRQAVAQPVLEHRERVVIIGPCEDKTNSTVSRQSTNEFSGTNRR